MAENKKWRIKVVPPEYLGVRLLVLSGLILIANLWSVHHLGSSLTNISETNAPLAIVGIISFLVRLVEYNKAKGDGKEVVVGFGNHIRMVLFYFLRTPVLIVLFILLFLIGSIVSSVTIMSSGVQDEMKVTLSPEGQEPSDQVAKELNGPSGVVRFLMLTTPFGRPFYLEAEGYLRYSFDLYPWVGTKIRVSKDLIVSPSVLIRVPTASRMFLKKGKVVVYDEKGVVAEAQTNEKQGAIIVGRDLPIPGEFIEKWKNELTGDAIEAAPAARSISAWRQPVVVQPTRQLIPESTLKAEFVIPPEIIKASTRFTVSSKKIQDVSMIKEVREP